MQGYGEKWQGAGDVVGVAADLDNNSLKFFVNGVDRGVAGSCLQLLIIYDTTEQVPVLLLAWLSTLVNNLGYMDHQKVIWDCVNLGAQVNTGN